MAGEGNKVYACRGATHSAAAIDGVTHASIAIRPIAKTAGNAVSGGADDSAIVGYDIRVRLYGNNQNALTGLFGDAAADVVIDTIGAAGALEKCTIKSVNIIAALSDVDIPERDSGGKVAAFGVEGVAHMGDADTLALMVVWAADV